MVQNMSINDTELKINKIFSIADIKYGISLFKTEEIDYVNSLIVEQEGKLYIKCQIKNEYKQARPEEIVRQLWIYRLLTDYGYPKERIEIERGIHFGSRESGYADITVLQEGNQNSYIIFETKRPERKEGLEQLQSYCNAEGAPIGVWSNGNEIVRFHREEPNIFVKIPRIPKDTETLKDILTERKTIKQLEKNDDLKEGKTTLKKILLDLEELVLGNSGVDSFEEIFKLIYAKLYDEWNGINDPNYQLEFFTGNRNSADVQRTISKLLDGAKRRWNGVFEPTDVIKLRDDHLVVCVSYLENIKLFNSNLRIIDDAFEYLIPQNSKQKEGQFFTPRIVEDMSIKMLNPKSNEFVIDPACGSAGFLLHSIMWISGGVISGKPLSLMAQNFAQNNIYGIDFSEKAVKIAKAINLIAGDGKSNILKDNSLAPQTWNDETRAGLRQKLFRFINEPEKDHENQDKFLYFDFDVLITNPPFAGTVEEKNILRLYKLAEKKGKIVDKIGRHILFLERSLHFVRPGGRMAIILPQGLLNNTSAEYIRRFIIDEARILAVVGLHDNTFKPHTGTKTSVLLLRKYTDEEKEKIQQTRAKYEGEWGKFLESLNEKYKNLAWDSSVDEEEIPEELNSFIATYFEAIEETDKSPAEEEEEAEEKENKKSILVLVQEKLELEESLNEKKEELENVNAVAKTKLKKEIKVLENKRNKLVKEIYQKTLAGQISLVLSDEKITKAFKKYWLDGKVMQEMDYPIFFAVNEKPVKDESGEYRYKKNPDGSFVLDESGYPVIDHDLNEIAEDFIKFAKEQLAKGDNHFDFWR